jgi:hypothetical protein
LNELITKDPEKWNSDTIEKKEQQKTVFDKTTKRKRQRGKIKERVPDETARNAKGVRKTINRK